MFTVKSRLPILYMRPVPFQKQPENIRLPPRWAIQVKLVMDLSRLRKMIWDGVIGPVREVHIWSDRPNSGYFGKMWPQEINCPGDFSPIPNSLDWDLFVVPSPMRLYNSAFHPFRWRVWWDFGNNALGDMGCHIFDPIFRALKLKYLTGIQEVSTLINQETYPLPSIARYEFPTHEDILPVCLIWYDGDYLLFPIPELEDGEQMGNNDRGTLHVSDKCKIFNDLILLRSLWESYKPPQPYIKFSPGHYVEWINACIGGETSGSNFDWTLPQTEIVLLGNIALRKELREKLSTQVLNFEPEKLTFSNIPEANNLLHCEYRKRWSLQKCTLM